MESIIRIVIALSIFISFDGRAQVTFIPDTAFEQFLIDQGVDTDGVLNGQVFTVDIEDEINLTMTQNGTIFDFVNDLTGIQDFESLEVLQIYQMPVSTLDLSQNLNLRILELDDMALDELIVSNNTSLERISLSLNSDSDMFSGNITSIDLSTNVLLEYANLGDSFAQIDLSNNTSLEEVRLQFLPDLTYVNLKNRNNLNIPFIAINNNPSLECFQVDDPAAVIAASDPPYDNWVIFDNSPSMIITDDCGLGISEYLLEQVTLFPNPVTNKLFIEVTEDVLLKKVELFDISGKLLLSQKATTQLNVSNLTSGIYFVSIATDKGVFMTKIIKN